MTAGQALPSSDRAPSEPVAVFIHVPKTGGTSLRQWLVEYFAGEVLIHKSHRRTSLAVDQAVTKPGIDTVFEPTVDDVRDCFSERGVAAFERFRAVIGHFTFDYPFVRALESRALICSLVRDPVERIISKYNWASLNRSHTHHAWVEGRTLFQSLNMEGPFLASCINKQLNSILGSRRTNRTWTIVCNYGRMELLTEKIATLYNRPAVSLTHRNRVDIAYRDAVRSQPDFHKAVGLIRELNAEELEFVNAVGDITEFNRA